MIFIYLFALLVNCGCKIFTYPIRFLMRAIMFFGGFYWISVDDRRKKPFQANIIVANHISIWDALKITVDTGDLRFSSSLYICILSFLV